MITYLQRLTDERDRLTQAATELAERAADDERDLSDTERDSMTSWQTRCAEIDAQLTEYHQTAESQRAYARLRDSLHLDDEPEPRPARQPVVVEQRGWGDRFVESDAFANYEGIGSSRRVEVPGLFTEQRAALNLGDFGGGPSTVISPVGPVFSTPLLDSIGRVTVGSNTVDWIEWTPQPPGPAVVVPEEGLKPEATMDAVPHTDALDTYAHWKGITRQALEDIPQIRSIVENRLRSGLYRALEAAAMTAIGAATLTNVTDPDLLAGIRQAIGTVQGQGYSSPNAALLNPADFADIDIAIMNGGVSGPVLNNSGWGVRFIAVPSVPAGTAYVGDLDAGVQLYERGTASVFMTDSHADMFIRNVILILAELRALVAVTEPGALVEVTVGTPV